MKIACTRVAEVAGDEQKRLRCAENLCRVSAPNEVKSCEAQRAIDKECENKQLPPVDF